MRKLLNILAAAAVTLVVAVGAVAGSTQQFAPTLTPWHAIGGVNLGILRSAVEYRHGRGRAYAADLITYVYRVSSGTLSVAYSKDHVEALLTDSPYFRGPDGFGVGSRIPLGECHHIAGGCIYTWRGFRYQNLAHRWVREVKWRGHRSAVFVDVAQGVVTAIQIVPALQ